MRYFEIIGNACNFTQINDIDLFILSKDELNRDFWTQISDTLGPLGIIGHDSNALNRNVKWNSLCIIFPQKRKKNRILLRNWIKEFYENHHRNQFSSKIKNIAELKLNMLKMFKELKYCSVFFLLDNRIIGNKFMWNFLSRFSTSKSYAT